MRADIEMEKKELLKILKDLAKENNLDPESNHARADEALLKYIDSKAVSKAFDNIIKWYA